MEGSNRLDLIDQNILQILSRYESMDLIELWYEIGEDIEGVSISKDEVLDSLEYLSSQGFVKCLRKDEKVTHWVLKR